jgi:hypothetical protein
MKTQPKNAAPYPVKWVVAILALAVLIGLIGLTGQSDNSEAMHPEASQIGH